MEFHIDLYMVVIAVCKLFVLMFTGYMLYYFKIIDEKFTDTLSLLLVKLIFPALIISKTISHFNFKTYSYWWVLPIAAIVLSLGGMIIGAVVNKFFGKNPSQKEVMCSCGFQNCGYLPMNLILFAFTGLVADRLLVYTFIFILGFNILVWSLVPLFLAGGFKKGFKLKIFLNPPVLATIFSIVWVAGFGQDSMPSIIMDPLKQLGQAAFPIAMLTLGSYLCRYKAYKPENKKSLGLCVLVKLILIPLIVLLILRTVSWSLDYKFFIFLQSMMPTAVSLVVIGSYSGANNKFISGTIFYTHLIAIFTIPLWMNIFNMLIN
jgi:malate permease and related proteins